MDLRSVQAVHIVVHSNKAPLSWGCWGLTQQGREGIRNYTSEQCLHVSQNLSADEHS